MWWMRCAYPNEASAEPPYNAYNANADSRFDPGSYAELACANAHPTAWEAHQKVILAGYAGEAACSKAFTAGIARMPVPIGL